MRLVKILCMTLFLPGWVACGESAADIHARLDELNSCEKLADCAFAGSQCGLGCGFFVNQVSVAEAKELIDDYEPQGQCAACPPMKTTCEQGKCQSLACTQEDVESICFH